MSSANTNPAAAIDDVRRQLASLEGRAKRSWLFTLILGAVALTMLTLYFTYGLRLLDEFTRPESLVTLGSQLLDDHLPRARQSLQEQITTQAPTWAEGLSRRAIDSVPTAREQLEKRLMEQIDQALDKATLLSESKFREFLTANRAELELSMKDLASSPELAEERLVELQGALEKQVQGDLEMSFRDAYQGLTLVNDKLDRLKNSEGLSEGEQIERRVLLLARTLQDERSPMPSARVTPAPSAAEGTATAPVEAATIRDQAAAIESKVDALPADPIAEPEKAAEPTP